MLDAELMRQGWDDYIRRKSGTQNPDCAHVRPADDDPPQPVGLPVPFAGSQTPDD
jgi:hypothetical protein